MYKRVYKIEGGPWPTLPLDPPQITVAVNNTIPS
jgi:hypothetical protein